MRPLLGPGFSRRGGVRLGELVSGRREIGGEGVGFGTRGPGIGSGELTL